MLENSPLKANLEGVDFPVSHIDCLSLASILDFFDARGKLLH